MPEDLPKTRADFERWVHSHLGLPEELEVALGRAFDSVFSQYERLWADSKQDAIRALSAGFARRMTRSNDELQAKNVTVSNIARYFEHLVAELTDKSQRDPKTQLMNFSSFTDQLEAFLAIEQRGRWCAVGLVDITKFKSYNDTLGHNVGDRIIVRVADLLREQVRTDDLLASDRPGGSRNLHARFGGDEFCFLIPALDDPDQARLIGERFRSAVADYDWTREDRRLGDNPVRVDVGVVCLWLGRVADRRAHARQIADALLQRADELMYAAKEQRSPHVHFARMQVDQGRVIDGTGLSGGAQWKLTEELDRNAKNDVEGDASAVSEP